jgi:uncharacterized membrane protein
MRAFTSRSRVTLAILLAVVVLLSVPAPALSASSSPPVKPLGDDGEARSSPGSRADAKWTYMVYMSADNNLEDEAILNFNQMEEVGSSDDVNMVLQLDRSPDWDETNGNWTGTRRYRVLQDTDKDIINSQLLEDMGEVDMGNGDNLRNFVVWAVTTYPADRYYLDVWGHGGGWRDGTCNDYTSGSVIDTDELGIALGQAKAITNVTLDGLGFDQCLMAQTEVYYEIKQFGDVLVGAESLIPADGYNYTRVMMPLVADPDMDAAELADVIVTAFFDEYGHDNERAHSAVDAEEMDSRLAPAITRMAQLLRANASSLRDEIKQARDLSQTYSTLDYIDLGNFTEQLLLKLPQNETRLRQAVIEVRENVTSSVVAEDHGIGRSGSTGLTFYFPRYGMAWSYGNIKMSVEGRWDEFLDAYFDKRDRPNAAPTVGVSAPIADSVVGLVFTMQGVANDTDGNVTHVEWKFDRGRWQSEQAGEDWTVNVSTAGQNTGLHRVSVRSRDDAGDYSPEVQFTLNVESKGLELSFDPSIVRTYGGGTAVTELSLSAFGEQGGHVNVEVFSKPAMWSVGLPFTDLNLSPKETVSGLMSVDVDAGSMMGVQRVIIRAWLTDAPLIQTFAALTIDVKERMADLVVGEITFYPPRPMEGEEVTVNFSVRNTGLATAVGFDVELLYILDPGYNSTTETLLVRFVDFLAVEQVLEISLAWTASIGLHEFIIEADPLGNNTDLDRDDNTGSRVLLLQGYDVMLEATPTEVNVTPGELVLMRLIIRNMGNLWDTLVLSHHVSSLGWDVRFNSTVFISDPRQTSPADMWITVPDSITGGTTEHITIRVVSSSDYSKFYDVNLTLRYVEDFGLDVSQDRDEATLGPSATDSFNVTIFNIGNGHENYTLEYIRQLDHLFISAVNDTVDVAPGGLVIVEVFFSTLDTNVGGQTFTFDLRVRSDDDATIVRNVSLNVTVARVFDLSAEIVSPSSGLDVLPNTPLLVPLSVTSNSNYPVTLEVNMVTGLDLFLPPVAVLGDVEPGATEEFNVVLVTRPEPTMGTYQIELLVREALDIHNATTVNAEVEVLRLDDSYLRVDDADATVLKPGVIWHAELLLINDGNHPETYILNSSFVPKWLRVELSKDVLTLEPYSRVLVTVNVSLKNADVDGLDTVMLVINAIPANQTNGAPKVVLDIALDVPSEEGSVTWGIVALLLIATVVVLAVLLYIRSDRFRS